MPDERPRHPSLPNSAFATACPTCGATAGLNTTVCGQCGAMLTGPTGTVVVDGSSTVITTGGGAVPTAGRGAVGAGTAGAGAGSGAGGSGAGGSGAGGLAGENADRLRERVQAAIGTDYRLIELLGRGGMGIVFRATESALDREVALKVLALDPILAPEAYERFEREAKLAARLDHPNIVPIFSVGRRESVAFYTMRLVRGGNVEEMLESRSRFEYDHALGILRDVAAALDYAHGRGVVHRDIKPANILIGETGHALVADFGIAKALGHTSAAAAMTGTGIIGSPGYMSPEQWKGDQVDGRADQYALAVVAFEMLAGRRPFESPNMQELLQKHLAGEIPAVSTYRFGLHEGVDDAMRRALAKSPGERFQTATVFVDALAGLRPAMATMRSVRVPRYEPPRRSRRRWTRVGIVALVLALSGGAAFAAPQTRPAAVRLADLAAGKARSVVERVRYAVVPPPLAMSDSLALGSAGGPVVLDSTSLTLGDPLIDGFPFVSHPGGDSASGSQTIAAGFTDQVRQPILLDPQSYDDQPSPFRSASPQGEYGWVRVVLHGGVAPIIVDGMTVSGMARPAGHVVRVEVGRHYVAVRGSGTLYTPSQVAIEVAANDTAEAIFAVPQAIIAPPEAAQPESAAQPVDTTSPPDSPERDSLSSAPAAPPAAPARPDTTQPDSARTGGARPDTTRPESALPDTTRPPPDTTRAVPPPR